MVWTVSPPEAKPIIVTSKLEIEFPSGARGYVLGAPDVTTGPSFTHAWVDDLTAFEDAGTMWRDLLLCGPRQTIVTAHPRAGAPGEALLRDLVLNQASVTTRVGTSKPVEWIGGRGFGQSPKAAEAIRAAEMTKEVQPLPQPGTYATVEEVREAFGAGSPRPITRVAVDVTGTLGPDDWNLIVADDGTTIMVVADEAMAERARKLLGGAL